MLFDEAIKILDTIDSWPNHDVPNENYYQSLKSRLFEIGEELGYKDSGSEDLTEFFKALDEYRKSKK